MGINLLPVISQRNEDPLPHEGRKISPTPLTEEAQLTAIGTPLGILEVGTQVVALVAGEVETTKLLPNASPRSIPIRERATAHSLRSLTESGQLAGDPI